jgi:hypothetical protein
VSRERVLTILALGGLVLAQPPKPGPEHKPLGYFVGKWESEGEMKPGLFGPGGKMTSSETCEWFAGKTFQSRYTIVETSPTAHTFTWETSSDKKEWTVVMEGKATKG